MNNLIQKIYLNHKNFWIKHNVLVFFEGVLFFAVALVIQHFAYGYIDNRASVTAVGDLFLDNLPTVKLDFFIVQGALFSSFVVIVLFFTKPKYLPFSLKTLALFIIARSFFISLTHLGADLNQLTLNINSIGL